MVKRLFNIKHDFKKGFDGGFDFNYKGLKIDVKTMGRNVNVKDYFVNNFISHQAKFNCDVYIFCSLNKKTNELTICGYAKKNDLLSKGVLIPKGSDRRRSDGTFFKSKADTYEIKNTDLTNIEKLFYYLPKY